MKRSVFLVVMSLAFFIGCTSVEVKPLDLSKEKISAVCIKKNPLVQVDDFLSKMESEFNSRKIKTKIFEGDVPAGCEYNVDYTARRSWDVTTFLSKFEIRISKDGFVVASMSYDSSSSLSLNKYSGTKEKMAPLFKNLFGELAD